VSISQSLHQRRISVVVSNPEFYTVVPDRSFRPRSDFPLAPQEATLELTHIIAAVQLAGYGEGEVVHRGHDRNRATIKTAETDAKRPSHKADNSASLDGEERDDAVLRKLGQEGTL
jgi:hypothetical protein